MTQNGYGYGPQTLWEGQSNDLTNAATGGRVVTATYKLTTESLFFSSGVLSTTEEFIPLWGILDADIVQSLTQKMLGVSDLRLKLDATTQARFGQAVVVIQSIKDARRVRDVMLAQANTVRAHWQQHYHTKSIEQSRAQAAYFNVGNPYPQGYPQNYPQQAAPASAPQPDLMDQLKKLGELHAAGVLSAEEFAAAKAKLLG